MKKRRSAILIAVLLSLYIQTVEGYSEKTLFDRGIEALEALAYQDNTFTPHYYNDVAINLLNFVHIANPDQNTFPPYNRLQQFGAWIYYDHPICVNTRTVVLVRDSAPGEVEYTTPEHCRVQAGVWFSPYDNVWEHSAKEIEIDHFVPLKNAYLAGAHNWTNQKRCQYANYLGNNFHLLSITMHSNRSKSDRGPEDYLPPNSRFRCDYIKRWLYIKVVWNLTFTQREFNAIKQTLINERCPTDTVYAYQSEIDREHVQMNNVPYGCTLRDNARVH